MKMPKRKIGIILIVLGLLFMGLASLMLVNNHLEDQKAKEESLVLVEEIHEMIKEEKEEVVYENTELPTVLINGYEYIGYLNIPDLGLELPIMETWDYDRLKIAPCRHQGSSRSDDLVLAAHDYDSHFGYLSELEVGSEIEFVDMEGYHNHYRLKKIETKTPDAVEEVLESDYDLVLYTCTELGARRIVAYFNRI